MALPNILLIGATGYLGSTFLQQLDRNKFGKIVCTFRTKPLKKSKICDLWISYEELQDLNSFKKN